jgi:hypothetical protein
MLSLFPNILFLTPLAPFLIRAALAVLVALAAWRHLSGHDSLIKVLSVFEIALAVALISGTWTQAAALLGIVYMGLALAIPRIRVYPISTILLSLVMFATLVVTGAGAFAFDLPL